MPSSSAHVPPSAGEPPHTPPSAYLASLIAAALEAHRAGHLDVAEPYYREALALDPAHSHALHYFGVLHHQRGAHAAAADLMNEALRVDPSDAACWSNRGLTAAALGRHAEAVTCYEQALQLQPDFADAHNNLGVALQAQHAFKAAIDEYQKALALDPALLDAHLNLGTALGKLDRHNDALACYRQVLSLNPRSAEAHFNAGNAHAAQGDSGAAIASFQQAIALRTDFAEAHVNLGSLIGKLGDYAGAEQQYRHAVGLRPNPTNLVCLGASLGAQGRLDQEEGFYRQALSLNPDYADAHQNLAWLLLKRGDYPQGWAEYAQRWRTADYLSLAVAGVPEWRGEPLEGLSVLLLGEQGFGDQLQFLRYAQVLAQRGASVDVCVREALVTLAARTPGVRHAFSGEPGETYDYWVPMTSVPSCVGTDLTTIPSTIPYVFADKTTLKAWHKRVGAIAGARRKVGLVWAGSPTFGNDRYRSVALNELSALSAVENVAWFSLQIGAASDQLASAPDDFRPHDFSAGLRNFDDTAALIMNLDLVIAVDTGVAHLAGALGKPVWLMLPANSDWRWLEHRSDSPWYPTARLFRQQVLGEWGAVVAQLIQKMERNAE